MSGITSVATSVMVGVGSRYETEDINGISHFLEHMVFKGTAKFPTTDDVNSIERIGGIQNAYTDIDITNYHNKVFATDWRQALEINKELALYPRLEEQYVDKERDVILEEMKRYEDQPAAKAEEQFHRMLYPGTRLGMRIIGEETSLRKTTSKELRNYHTAWYQPNRMVIVLSGGVEGYAEDIRKQVEEWFGVIQTTSKGSIDQVTPVQKEPNTVIVTKPDAQQAHFFLGVRTFSRTNEDRFAWSVFNLLMGVGFTSRLFREVREKRGLCYQITSSSDNYADVGSWGVYAGVATEKVTEAVEAITHEFGKFIQSGASDEEVEIAKKRLKTILSFKAENPEFLGEYYGRQEVFEQPILTLDDYLARIQAVTTESVNRVVRKYLTKETLNLSLVWNKASNTSGLQKLLQF